MRKNNGSDRVSVSEEAAFELGVLYTTIKTNIESFTAKASTSYSFADVATRVARLLESEALREEFRGSELVPEMREVRNGDRRGRWARGADAASSSVFGNSSRGRPLKRVMTAAGRAAISAAQRERWRKAKGRQRRKAAKPRTKMDGTPDRRFSPEAKEKQRKAMQKRMRDPVWVKAMLKRMAAMRARKNGKPVKRMSEATKQLLREARLATVAAKRAKGQHPNAA